MPHLGIGLRLQSLASTQKDRKGHATGIHCGEEVKAACIAASVPGGSKIGRFRAAVPHGSGTDDPQRIIGNDAI